MRSEDDIITWRMHYLDLETIADLAADHAMGLFKLIKRIKSRPENRKLMLKLIEDRRKCDRIRWEAIRLEDEWIAERDKALGSEILDSI